MGAAIGHLLGEVSLTPRANNQQESSATAHQYRYPPRGNASFFASHFIMGGEKFDSPQPESFLFGENSDLNFLCPKPVAFPYPPPQPNEPTKTLRSLINIRRDSVHFVKVAAPEEDENQDPKYHIEFTFDSDVRCAIRIFYFCSEEELSTGTKYDTKRNDLTSQTYEYSKGAKQVFSQPSHIFDPSKCVTELDLISSETSESDLIPVVIQCVSLEGDKPKQSHSTLASIDKSNEKTYTLKAVKQKIFVDGLSYLLQEVYGLENKILESSPLTDDDDDVEDTGAECVVCMCETRDTIILPCRHLCLCNACADSLRYQANNCPICRAPFRALLQIRAVQKVSSQVTHPALADPTEVAAQQGVPPGYQMVTLVDALNGPIVRNRRKSSAENRKKKKSKSAKKKTKKPGNSSSSKSDAASPTEPSNPDEHSEEASTSETVSLSIVNEVSESPALKSTSKAVKVTPVGSKLGSLDLIEEELANMSVPDSPETITESQSENNEEDKSEEKSDMLPEATVVVNIKNGASRISIPGTPTSIISIRSSPQESSSSSSSSSTKKLLPTKERKQTEEEEDEEEDHEIEEEMQHPLSTRATSSKSVGSAVIVNVRPFGDEDQDEDEHVC